MRMRGRNAMNEFYMARNLNVSNFTAVVKDDALNMFQVQFDVFFFNFVIYNKYI